MLPPCSFRAASSFPIVAAASEINQRLLRLLEFQHEIVHRAGRLLRREIARILGVTPEISLCDELEAGRLNLTAQYTLVDAMQGLADRDLRARLGRMVSDHQHAARLERRKHLAGD